MSLFEMTKSHALRIAIFTLQAEVGAYEEEKRLNDEARASCIAKNTGRRGFLWRRLDSDHWAYKYDRTDYGYVTVRWHKKRVDRARALVRRIELMDGEFRVQLGTEDMDLLATANNNQQGV
tara:strand:+ start:173 stop:535 length:363 start_codon:yes stop_codon:yes gene_type:complete